LSKNPVTPMELPLSSMLTGEILLQIVAIKRITLKITKSTKNNLKTYI
jgi:hypothetical protein